MRQLVFTLVLLALLFALCSVTLPVEAGCKCAKGAWPCLCPVSTWTPAQVKVYHLRKGIIDAWKAFLRSGK